MTDPLLTGLAAAGWQACEQGWRARISLGAGERRDVLLRVVGDRYRLCTRLEDAVEECPAGLVASGYVVEACTNGRCLVMSCRADAGVAAATTAAVDLVVAARDLTRATDCDGR